MFMTCLINGPNIDVTKNVKKLLKTKFGTKDLGPATKIVGISIIRNRSAVV